MAKLLTLAGIFLAGSVPAQEAIHELLGNQGTPALEESDTEAYTFRVKDFRVLTSASLGIDYNDNVGISKENTLSDVIVRPMVKANGYWPITDHNRLTFNVGVGYDKYLQHDQYSSVNLTSGSGVMFDVEVGDFRFNFHDRFSYMQDAAQQSMIAGNGQYGQILNIAGVNGIWDLGDLTTSLGYDHQNTMSTSGTAESYQSQDHSSEAFVGRSGLRVHPEVTVGFDATATFTAYDKQVLNDNNAYSLGAFTEWQRDAFRLTPRVGYSIYDFSHSSSSVETANSDSWYADLSANYRVTDKISTSLSGGHEVRMGIQSDAVEIWYLRPGVSWALMDRGTLSYVMSYENGKQGVGNRTGNLVENYDYFSNMLGFQYGLGKNLTGSANYRFVTRTSSNASRDYIQNIISLQLTYFFQ